MMEMKRMMRNLIMPLAFITFQNMPPLVSTVHAQKGDDMGGAMREREADPKLNADIEKAVQIMKDSRPAGKITDSNLDNLISVWNDWKNKQAEMPSEQKRKFLELFYHPSQGLTKAFEFTDAQKEKLYDAELMRRTESRPVPLIRGEELRAPRMEFFPEAAATRKSGGIGTPDVRLGQAIKAALPDEQEQAFSSQIGGAVRTQLVYGKGSTEARQAGEEILTRLRQAAGGDLRDLVGGNAGAIEKKLREGDIVGAMQQNSLVEGLQDSVNRLVIEKPVALLTLGGESPRIFLGDSGTYKLYISGLLLLDMLVSETYKGSYEGGDLVMKPTGEKNADIVQQAGPKGTVEFKKGMELSLAPTATIPIGIPDSWPARFNLQLGFRDLSGNAILPKIETPLYYGAILEYETPGTLKYKLDVGVAAYNVKGWTIMPVIDWTHYVVGQRDIERPNWMISPGLKFAKGQHDIGVRGIKGENVVGGGAFYKLRQLTLGLDVTKTETRALGRLPSLGGWFAGFTVSVDLGKEVE